MEIKKFDISMVSEVVKLWNENVVPYEIYAEFTDELFVGEILKNPCFNEEGCVVAVEGNEIVGFATGSFRKNAEGKAVDPAEYIEFSTVQ